MSKNSNTDPLPHLHAVATTNGDVFAALADGLGATLGHRLFTALRYHSDSGETERFYSSNPDAYPVGGRKPPNPTFWTQHLLIEGKPYIGYDAHDIRAVFFDHELIASLGCAAILNLPVCHQGRVIGTLNLLHGAGWYDTGDIPLGQTFAALAVPIFLALAD
jgi:hypothetical protein